MNSTEWLYKTRPGRVVLKVLISRPVSVLGGKSMDSGLSSVFIRPFVKACGIDLRDYRTDGIHSFNDFFCRRIKEDNSIPK